MDEILKQKFSQSLMTASCHEKILFFRLYFSEDKNMQLALLSVSVIYLLNSVHYSAINMLTK